jgi:hypothetical protein
VIAPRSIYGMENKRLHLEMIQGVIDRMASNLFFLKGWAITLIAGLFALAAKDANPKYFVIAYFPAIVFWILDGYFLSMERSFRDLYDDVRRRDPKDIDFSMNPTPYKEANPRNGWLRSMRSSTLLWFYLPLLGLMLFITYLMK